MKKYHALFILILLMSIQACSSQELPDITRQELYEHIEFLASDSLKGRYPGTPEDKVAAQYIAYNMEETNLELLYDNGLQAFEITTKLDAGENNSLSINDQDFIIEQDFSPIVFSSNSIFEGEVVFVGYGYNISQGNNSWNDYKNVDVKNKWVLILRGEPDVEEPFPFGMYSGLRSKAITAKDAGAAGVIFVSGPVFDEDDDLIQLDKPEGEIDIPVIHVKREVANIILSQSENNIKELENSINSDSHSFATKTTLKCQTEVLTGYAETYNVVSQLIVNPSYEYVVIGGHYDHLGFGGQGTGTRALGVNEVHYGADDNASGVAAVLEIAEKLASKKDSLNNNYLFVAFGAEEMGLIGSKYFVNNLPIPDTLIKAMINIDMIGRMKSDKSFQVNGVGSSIEGESIINELNNHYNFKIGFSQEGYGPSDHSSFYSKDLPVFFFTTGAHIDYHTPGDSLGNINFKGLFDATNFIYDFAYNISANNLNITFKEAGPKMPDGNNRNKKLKVTLGIMPDFSGVEKRGLRADLVIKGKPADKAGMITGDIITAIDGHSVGDVYEYMERLSKLKSGQIITIEIIREDKKEVLIVQL